MARMYIGDQEVAPVVPQVVDKTVCGVSIDNLLRVDGTGSIYGGGGKFVFNGGSATNVGQRGLYYKFANKTEGMSFLLPNVKKITGWYACESACYLSSVQEVDLHNLEEVAGDNAFKNAFYGSSGLLKKTGLAKLKIVSGGEGCSGMYSGQRGLTETGLESLEEISGYSGCSSMFDGCDGLLSTGLTGLKKVTGNTACSGMFKGCTKLTKEYFPNLIDVSGKNAFGSSSYNTIFNGCTNLVEIHFRADMQAQIEELSAYGTKFGATNATIYFDL